MDKPKTNYLKIILISFACILFSAGIYLLGRQFLKTPKMPVTVLPESTIIQTDAEITTDNWETYTDNAIGFTIKLPPEYRVATNGLISIVKKYTEGKDNEGVGIVDRKGMISSSNAVATCEAELCMNLTDSNWTSELVSINNATGIKVLSALNPNRADYYLNNLNETKVIRATLGGTTFDMQNKILSTFKFTESKSSNTIIKQSGYIRELIKTGTLWTAKFESVDILSASQCKSRGIQAPNGNCIIDSKQITNYEISPNTVVTVYSLNHLPDENTEFDEKISYDDFLKYMLNHSSPELKSSLYSIEMKNNQIYKISERYQP
ncbi:MAG: hypothetical protein WC069_03445 [Candidatus Shapirobacteria bacterium]